MRTINIGAQGRNYFISSNGESGMGRYDIMMVPKAADSSLPAILIEFKLFDSRKERNLTETVHRALQQIEERKYESKLIETGFDPERIIRYGFGFSGKKVKVIGNE